MLNIRLLILYIPQPLQLLVLLLLLLASIIQTLYSIHLMSHLVALSQGVIGLNLKLHLQLLDDDGLGGLFLLNLKGLLLLD